MVDRAMGVKHSGYYKMLAPQEKAAGALRGGLTILSASVFVFVSRSHQDAHAQQGIDIKKAAACSKDKSLSIKVSNADSSSPKVKLQCHWEHATVMESRIYGVFLETI